MFFQNMSVSLSTQCHFLYLVLIVLVTVESRLECPDILDDTKGECINACNDGCESGKLCCPNGWYVLYIYTL